jgi:hypothetical protein
MRADCDSFSHKCLRKELSTKGIVQYWALTEAIVIESVVTHLLILGQGEHVSLTEKEVLM